MTEKTRLCENCARAIGKLETVHIYRDHIVCAECNARLRKQDDNKKSNMQPNNEVTHFIHPEQSETKPRWNGFCITAFVVSLLLIPGPSSGFSEEVLQLARGMAIVLFVLSITFACIGLSQVGKNPSMRGKGLGIAAIIISIASAFISILF
ncbi:MAG TPA: hypothetical protein VMW16_08100 [Sedimentisphaerales bacterium]|nr:hypothetical protein [Sedimentisphaerales bacterium]